MLCPLLLMNVSRIHFCIFFVNFVSNVVTCINGSEKLFKDLSIRISYKYTLTQKKKENPTDKKFRKFSNRWKYLELVQWIMTNSEDLWNTSRRRFDSYKIQWDWKPSVTHNLLNSGHSGDKHRWFNLRCDRQKIIEQCC